jgi:hypothetical protein
MFAVHLRRNLPTGELSLAGNECQTGSARPVKRVLRLPRFMKNAPAESAGSPQHQCWPELRDEWTLEPLGFNAGKTY